VCLTDADVQRIIDGTGKAAASFVQFYDEDGVELAPSSPFWVAFADKPAVMALRSTHGHCVFLDRDNRCTIYDHRPVTCRQHPFDIQLSKSGAVKHLSVSRVVDCPHGWNGKLTKRGLRTLLCWNDRQVTRYFAKVREWKRMREVTKTPKAFLKFLGFGT
jgi:Fe-S-cluster containining protein